DLYGSQFAAGREARLELAERLLARNDPGDFLAAELHLEHLRLQRDEPPMVARALEALARLRTRRGLLEDAARCYQKLGRDFADTVIRDGKTGADFFHELATDKRFWPYLEEPRSPWAGGSVKAHKHPIQNRDDTLHPHVVLRSSVALEPEGEVLPFFERHRVSLALDGPYAQLQLTDHATHEERWRSP